MTVCARVELEDTQFPHQPLSQNKGDYTGEESVSKQVNLVGSSIHGAFKEVQANNDSKDDVDGKQKFLHVFILDEHYAKSKTACLIELTHDNEPFPIIQTAGRNRSPLRGFLHYGPVYLDGMGAMEHGGGFLQYSSRCIGEVE